MSVIEIHTSDRQTYKRCRRRFGWGSTLRDNLIAIGPSHKAFFIGTGFHFALEDWWGLRRFSHPALAFAAYYDAQKRSDLPEDAPVALELATGMLSYYVEDWLVEHPEEYETLWVDGVPQVEVEVAISLNGMLQEELDLNPRYSQSITGAVLHETIRDNSVEYICTFDRVVMDRHERIWGLDYKTAAQFDELNLQTNPQAGSYDCALNWFYGPSGYPVAGMIWQQHKKSVPVEPKLVYVGTPREGLSLDMDQSTTYRLYRQAITAIHGNSLPERYNGVLAKLAGEQDESGDRFVRRDLLRRNDYQREVETDKIIAEVLEMLDPDLPLYPNPTKDCSWDCPFKVPCLAKDDGSDFEHILSSEYTQWAGYKDDWRSRVKYPDAKDSEPTFVFA